MEFVKVDDAGIKRKLQILLFPSRGILQNHGITDRLVHFIQDNNKDKHKMDLVSLQ